MTATPALRAWTCGCEVKDDGLSPCVGHAVAFLTGIEEYQASHPDDRCTATCGCVSLEELRASYVPLLGDDEGGP